jgi:hypothetical protein
MYQDHNPYTSPGEGGEGGYDWTLAKRMWMAFASLAIVYLLASAVGSWQVFRADCNHRHEPALHTVAEFFTDWRDNNGLE